MNKRDFLKGLMAATALAAIPVALKSEALASTSISPPKARAFHFKYDSVAMAYVKEVLGRTEPLPPVIKNRNMIPVIVKGRDLVPPDPEAAAILLEEERNYRLRLSLAEWDRVYTYKLP